MTLFAKRAFSEAQRRCSFFEKNQQKSRFFAPPKFRAQGVAFGS
jgi:hypothetical protein